MHVEHWTLLVWQWFCATCHDLAVYQHGTAHLVPFLVVPVEAEMAGGVWGFPAFFDELGWTSGLLCDMYMPVCNALLLSSQQQLASQPAGPWCGV